MRAMILAAGLGTRMRPLTDHTPKPLFPVAGHPLIAWSLGLLKNAGITDIVINIHHHAEKMKQALAPYRDLGLNIEFSYEEDLLETGGGIAFARTLLHGERFIALNADIICDIDLATVVEAHLRSGSIASMVLRPNPDPAQISVVEWDPNRKHILDIRGEIRAHSHSSQSMMFTGIHIMESTVFEYLLPVKESIITAFYLPALRERRFVHGIVHEGYWADLGTAEQYNRVCGEIAAGLPLVHARPAVIAPVSAS